MHQFSNFVVLSGEAQNTGKTTLACRIISKFARQNVVAIKISPHLHLLDYPLPLLFETESYRIFQEVNTNKLKDSSRFLKAGAAKVLLLFSGQDALGEAIPTLAGLIPDDQPVICESGGIIKWIIPSVHILLTSREFSGKIGVDKEPDVHVALDGNSFNFDLNRLEWNGKKWLLRPEYIQ